jgi:phosphatidylglycerol:prolipoprotein diacylglycerol transferase
MIEYPRFDKIAFEIGPFGNFGPLKVHWYGIMYLVAFTAGWMLARLRAKKPGSTWKPNDVDDFMFFCMLGTILGGRFGYVLFYGLKFWKDDVWYPFKVWDGGMSFHGGLLGVLFAGWLWSWRNGVAFFDAVDFVAPLVPIGLGLGRLGNFIGGELWGKHTDAPWGVIFPRALEGLNRTRDELHRMYLAGELNHEARHPSQLYEFTLEGLVMFTVLWIYSRKPRPRYAVSGLFALLYGIFRFAIEFVREPDVQLGYLAFGWVTMGQVLSLPLIAVGVVLLWLSHRSPTLQPQPRHSGAGEAGTRNPS